MAIWPFLTPFLLLQRQYPSRIDVFEWGSDGRRKRWWFNQPTVGEQVNIHPFPPSSSVDVSGSSAATAAPSAVGEPAFLSDGSITSADAAGVLGGRFGWLYWPEGGQRQHHCRRLSC